VEPYILPEDTELMKNFLPGHQYEQLNIPCRSDESIQPPNRDGHRQGSILGIMLALTDGVVGSSC